MMRQIELHAEDEDDSDDGGGGDREGTVALAALSVEEVQSFLRHERLTAFCGDFAELEINGEMLADLDMQVSQSLGRSRPARSLIGGDSVAVLASPPLPSLLCSRDARALCSRCSGWTPPRDAPAVEKRCVSTTLLVCLFCLRTSPRSAAAPASSASSFSAS